MRLPRADILRQELRSLIEEKNVEAISRLTAQVEWIEGRRSDHQRSAEAWVFRAQLGTLEKFKNVLAQSALLEGSLIVALARNAFENLIWLKLFNRDRHYGLVFYQQLLQQQIVSQEQAIAKAQEEVALFNQLQIEDCLDYREVQHLVDKTNPSESDQQEIRNYYLSHKAAVEAKARMSFSIYADQALSNGYRYQAHLIETKGKHAVNPP